MPLNIEIKARCQNPQRVRSLLQEYKADFRGIDHQIDTYFNVINGRLKLREGNIENALIHYQRNDDIGPKKSEVILYKAPADINLKSALSAAIGVKVVVDKQRAIYFIDNVKFHVDEVKSLGSFIEIEAIDNNDHYGEEKLQTQCEHYMKLFQIQEKDLINVSYSDLMMM